MDISQLLGARARAAPPPKSTPMDSVMAQPSLLLEMTEATSLEFCIDLIYLSIEIEKTKSLRKPGARFFPVTFTVLNRTTYYRCFYSFLCRLT